MDAAIGQVVKDPLTNLQIAVSEPIVSEPTALDLKMFFFVQSDQLNRIKTGRVPGPGELVPQNWW